MVLSANSFTGDPQRGIGLGMIGPLPAGRVSARQELATSQGRDRDGPRLGPKTCPMCAEPALAAARIRRFCGHKFDDAAAKPA